jgi:hypothetical protein
MFLLSVWGMASEGLIASDWIGVLFLVSFWYLVFFNVNCRHIACCAFVSSVMHIHSSSYCSNLSDTVLYTYAVLGRSSLRTHLILLLMLYPIVASRN